MQKKIAKGFTIIELLVVLAVIGVFAVVAYPNISNWIADRNVKKEVYDVVSFIKERKSEVTSGKYGMTQLLLNRTMEVYTMSPQDFSNTYHGISNSSSYKTNKTCGFGDTQPGLKRRTDLERLKLSSDNSNSNVHIYPSAWHNPFRTVLCITKDGTIKFTKYPNKTEKDPSTGQNVDIFVFCSKSNSTQQTCKLNTNLDYRYKITLDNFQNIKIYKYNKKKNSWISIDG
jgi:type IV fimbrial biogenesis protein FimT|tara:strand:- start:132 stop:818 length:687 start_codon:yes stop_codon:yes gene_type:complete